MKKQVKKIMKDFKKNGGGKKASKVSKKEATKLGKELRASFNKNYSKIIKKQKAMDKIKNFLIKEGYNEKEALKLMNTKQDSFFNLNTYDFYHLTGNEKSIIEYFQQCLHGELMGS